MEDEDENEQSEKEGNDEDDRIPRVGVSGGTTKRKLFFSLFVSSFDGARIAYTC